MTPQVGITMDLTATILAVAGAPVPADAKPEGIDLLPILEGRSPGVERTLFFRIASMLRQQRAVRQGDWKLLLDGDDILVFNVRTDVGERNDVAASHPEVARRLRPLLAAWEKDVDAEAKARTNTQ